MSNLESLIDNLCPNGVEYKEISEVVEVERGKRVVRNQLSQEKGYPVFQNSLTSMGFYTDYNFPANTTFVIGGGAAGEIGYSAVDFWAADDCYPMRGNCIINSRYLFHLLLSKKNLIESKVRRASIPRLSRDSIGSILIPVPPIPVQEEIVRILDKFTALSQELSQELSLRKKQYEYYKNSLLSFEENVPRMRLGEIGSVCMCKRILKSQTNSSAGVPFYKIGTFGKEADSFISIETFTEYTAKYKFPKKGDVLISAAGTIGRTVIYDGKPAYFQDSNIVWLDNDETKVLNPYLYYCYSTKPWKISKGGTIPRLYNENILNAVIPVPSLREQAKIVDVLDRFDKLTTDISIGLPAEIAARRKQYEYYRDHLLTFPAKAN